jgi:Cd(II)/Pb(II)-responsive transcriptional regulator
MKMKIGELADISGCQVVTIRFYEKEGLLAKPERTESNYRLYGDKDIERLRFIRHCRHHGMKLSEIRELLTFKDNPNTDCGWINTLVEKHIENVTEQINSLTLLKEQLQLLLHKCSGNAKSCGIIKSLNEADGCHYCENLSSKCT